MLLWLAYTVKQKINPSTQVRELLFSPDGQILYGGGQFYTPQEYYGWVCAWDAATGRLLWQQRLWNFVATLALSPDGSSLLTAGTQG